MQPRARDRKVDGFPWKDPGRSFEKGAGVERAGPGRKRDQTGQSGDQFHTLTLRHPPNQRGVSDGDTASSCAPIPDVAQQMRSGRASVDPFEYGEFCWVY